jgi:hypothetical protein
MPTASRSMWNFPRVAGLAGTPPDACFVPIHSGRISRAGPGSWACLGGVEPRCTTPRRAATVPPGWLQTGRGVVQQGPLRTISATARQGVAGAPGADRRGMCQAIQRHVVRGPPCSMVAPRARSGTWGARGATVRGGTSLRPRPSVEGTSTAARAWGSSSPTSASAPAIAWPTVSSTPSFTPACNDVVAGRRRPEHETPAWCAHAGLRKRGARWHP